MRDCEELHGREEFAPSDLYGAVALALAARLPRGRSEMATWQTAVIGLEIPDLPGDAQGIDAWRRFIASVKPTRRDKTQLATLACCCCGGVIAAGERHNWYGGTVYVCASCVRDKEAVA